MEQLPKRKEKYDKYDKARSPVIWSCAWHRCHIPANIDTYAGCSFGCKYCFTRGKGSSFFHYREQIVPMPFNEILSRVTRITAKGDELPYNDGVFQRYKWAFDNITYKIGVRYDPLPGIETVIKNTLKTIKIFAGKDLVIQTKNPGLLRGEYLDTGTKLITVISVPSPNNYLEENAPPFKYRVAEGKRLMKSGLRVSWRFSPALPTQWSDDQLEAMFDTDVYGITCSGFESTTPKDIHYDIAPNMGENYFHFAMKMRDLAIKYDKPIHFVEPWLRELGTAKTCLPEGCKYWQGTVFDDNPILPDDVKIHPIKRGAKPTPIKELFPAHKERFDRKIGKITF